MVEILFEGGKARELQESDVPVLVEMCYDEGILKYFFSSGNRNIEFYWNSQLREQSSWGGRMDQDRSRYLLPIEHNGIAKGCLLLESKEEGLRKRRQIKAMRKSGWLDDISLRKDFVFGLPSLQRELDWRGRHNPASRSHRYNDDGPLIETSYFIGREHRRQGIARATIKSARTFACEKLDAGKIVARVVASNLASRALLERQGFKVGQKSEVMSGPCAGEEIFIYDLSSTVFEEIWR